MMRSHVTVAWAEVLSLLLGTLLPLISLLDFVTAFLLLFVACWRFERRSAVAPTLLHAELVMRGAGPCGKRLLQWWWLALLAHQCVAVSASGRKSVRVPCVINGLLLVYDSQSKAQR
jgi:hypothetical protein